MNKIAEHKLLLWKIRQEKEGYNVSRIETLEQAEDFNTWTEAQKKRGTKSTKKKVE